MCCGELVKPIVTPKWILDDLGIYKDPGDLWLSNWLCRWATKWLIAISDGEGQRNEWKRHIVGLVPSRTPSFFRSWFILIYVGTSLVDARPFHDLFGDGCCLSMSLVLYRLIPELCQWGSFWPMPRRASIISEQCLIFFRVMIIWSPQLSIWKQ